MNEQKPKFKVGNIVYFQTGTIPRVVTEVTITRSGPYYWLKSHGPLSKGRRSIHVHERKLRSFPLGGTDE